MFSFLLHEQLRLKSQNIFQKDYDSNPVVQDKLGYVVVASTQDFVFRRFLRTSECESQSGHIPYMYCPGTPLPGISGTLKCHGEWLQWLHGNGFSVMHESLPGTASA